MPEYAITCQKMARGSFIQPIIPIYKYFWQGQRFAVAPYLTYLAFSVLLSGLTIVSIQMMLSMLYRSSVVPTGAGLLFILGGVIARSLAISIYWPFLWPILLLNNTPDTAQWRLSFGVAGTAGFFIVSIVSIMRFCRAKLS